MDCELELGGDGEPIEGYERRETAIDRDAQCWECDRTIPAGAVHEVVTGEYDGEPIEWRTCMDCFHIAKAFQTEGRTHGTLWGALEESGGLDGEPAFDNFNSACLARVETAEAKSYLQQRYRKWKGLA